MWLDCISDFSGCLFHEAAHSSAVKTVSLRVHSVFYKSRKLSAQKAGLRLDRQRTHTYSTQAHTHVRFSHECWMAVYGKTITTVIDDSLYTEIKYLCVYLCR